jgi:N-acetylglutamate synthase-like GNAT family acetyltransferase
MLRRCSAVGSVSFHRIAWGSAEYRKTIEIRDLVLRRPHGQSIAGDDLRLEKRADLFAAISGPEIIGTAYLTPLSPGVIQLRQLAIHPEFQRRGIGFQFMLFLEREAVKCGASRVYLEARVAARKFYENLRYRQISGEFLYRTIPHLKMEKLLAIP